MMSNAAVTELELVINMHGLAQITTILVFITVIMCHLVYFLSKNSFKISMASFGDYLVCIATILSINGRFASNSNTLSFWCDFQGFLFSFGSILMALQTFFNTLKHVATLTTHSQSAYTNNSQKQKQTETQRKNKRIHRIFTKWSMSLTFAIIIGLIVVSTEGFNQNKSLCMIAPHRSFTVSENGFDAFNTMKDFNSYNYDSSWFDKFDLYFFFFMRFGFYFIPLFGILTYSTFVLVHVTACGLKLKQGTNGFVTPCLLFLNVCQLTAHCAFMAISMFDVYLQKTGKYGFAPCVLFVVGMILINVCCVGDTLILFYRETNNDWQISNTARTLSVSETHSRFGNVRNVRKCEKRGKSNCNHTHLQKSVKNETSDTLRDVSYLSGSVALRRLKAGKKAIKKYENYSDFDLLIALLKEVVKNGFERKHLNEALKRAKTAMSHKRNEKLSKKLNLAELLSIVIYCDYDTFCIRLKQDERKNGNNWIKYVIFNVCLQRAMSKLYKNDNYKKENVFCGLRDVSFKSLKKEGDSLKEMILFPTIMSFTKDVSVARKFAGNKGVIMKLRLSKNDNIIGCDVSWISYFAREREFLVSDFNQFMVKLVKNVNSKQFAKLCLNNKINE